MVLLQSAQERREWKRFGDAVAQQPEHSVTVQSREDVPFERTKAQKSTRDEKQQLSLQSAMQSNDKNAVTAKYALCSLLPQPIVNLLCLICSPVTHHGVMQLERHAVQEANGEATGSS